MSIYTDFFPSGIKHNFAAIVAPTATDDSSIGYVVGSRWVDTVTGLSYTCVDSTTGAAIWDATVLHTTWKGVAAGTANAVTITSWGGFPETKLVTGMVILVNFPLANIGPMTLDLDGLGAKPIVGASGMALVAGSIKANTRHVVLSYDGISWVIMGSNSIGVGQTWQDVTATRALGVTYTNTTGRSIEVTANALSTTIGGIEQLLFRINGVLRTATSDITALNANSSFLSIIVPAGDTYQIGSASANVTIANWHELR